jgi:flagellar basal-body rod modification protein FlgD
MTTITDTNAAAGFGGVAMATKPAGAMDQNDFLRLMTTQLTTQDPFNPVDNTEMVAQMAQFSQVAGISEMNQSLKALVEAMAPGRLTDAASWIGRTVLVASETAMPLKDGSYSAEIALPKDADEVSVSFVDANGAVVHSRNFSGQKAGTLPVAWDGRNEAGETVATGPLKIVVTANAGGEAIQPATASWTQVNGIQSPANGGSTKLLTGLGALTPDAALRLA